MGRMNKKLILALSFSALFCSLFLVPSVQGYGTSFYSAETISNGVTTGTFYSYDSYAYYKIYASMGNRLSVSLSYYADGNDIDLRLYDSAQVPKATSTNAHASESLAHTCTTSGDYYIVLYRYSGTSDTPIYLSVSGASSTPTVPGFDVTALLAATAFAAVIAVILMRRRGRASFSVA